MTRFARAKGSKASNERIPEEATSWSEMKQQLLEKNKQAAYIKKKQEIDKEREQNYKKFLNSVEEEESQNSKWAEFPTEKTNKLGSKNEKKLQSTVPVTVKKDKVENNIGNQADDTTKKEKPLKKKKKVLNTFPEDTDKTDQEEQNSNKIMKKKRPKTKKKLLNIVPEVSNIDQVENSNETNNVQKKNVVLKKNKKVKRKLEEENESSPTKKKIKKSVSATDNTLKHDTLKEKKSPKKRFKKVNNKETKKNIDPKNLSEEDLKKIEKKKQKQLRQSEKRKLFKKPDPKTGKIKERRKQPLEKLFINGQEIDIAYVDGFPIKKEDAERIQQLRKQMVSKGLPRSEIKIALKLERRKAEKALAREKKKVCFNCRMSGHNLSECPDLGKQLAESAGTGICFKCGSTEHTHFECKVVKGQEFKFAQCFICHEQGHIARQCPDNARGMYPKGGACKVCGDVTHLKKDCPKYQAEQQQQEERIQIETIGDEDNPDSLGKNEEPIGQNINFKRPNKIVKF